MYLQFTKLTQNPFLSSYLTGRYLTLCLTTFPLFISYSRILPKFTPSWSTCFLQDLPGVFLPLLLSISLPVVGWLPPHLCTICICLKLPTYNMTMLTIFLSLCTDSTCLPYHLMQTSQRSISLSSLPRNEPPLHSCEPLSHLTSCISSLFRLFLIKFALINKEKRGKRY